ncbi:MAG TPA: hypothetical protein VGN79_12310 [Devosia sp.]|jgi:microcompartment protein CcmK/EutM|nr:hypothetical protein [Devosia sp.]
MLLKNKKSGEVETMRHGPATDAVGAGTHEFVNVDGDGKVKAEKSKPAKASDKK